MSPIEHEFDFFFATFFISLAGYRKMQDMSNCKRWWIPKGDLPISKESTPNVWMPELRLRILSKNSTAAIAGLAECLLDIMPRK